jgi:hypothetical protein
VIDVWSPTFAVLSTALAVTAVQAGVVQRATFNWPLMMS